MSTARGGSEGGTDDPMRAGTKERRVRVRGVLADTRPLANQHFRRLWVANIVTVIGAQLTVVAVPAQIYAMTGSSAYVGLTGRVRPGPAGGVRPVGRRARGRHRPAHAADRDHDRADRLTSAAVLGAGGRRQPNVWLLLGLFSVQQAFFAVNQPTRSAVLPKLLAADLLPAANSLNMTVMQAGAIAGPLVGGALIPVLGFALALPARHDHPVRDARRGVCAATAARGRRGRDSGSAVGHRRAPLPARSPGAADVLRGRPHRDGLRDAAGAVPGDGPRRLRWARQRRPRVRAAVRGDPGRRGARRGLLRLGLPGRAARGSR